MRYLSFRNFSDKNIKLASAACFCNVSLMAFALCIESRISEDEIDIIEYCTYYKKTEELCTR